MKDQLTIHHLARRLPYGLLMENSTEIVLLKGLHEDAARGGLIANVWTKLKTVINGCSGISREEYLYYSGVQRLKPILRPLTDLTKPISQANYNEGKEFVPLDEIVIKSTYLIGASEIEMCVNNKNWIKHLPYEVIELLLQWHFVIEEPNGTWIDVNSLDKNLY